MLFVLSPAQFREEKGLPEEDRILLSAQDLTFDDPLGNRTGSQGSRPKEGAFGSVFRSRKAGDTTHPPPYEQGYFR